MSVNDRVMQALSFLDCPIYPNTYTGDADTYIVFNINASPDDFGDNKPGYNVNFVQVHLFCPHTLNSIPIRKSIKKALFETDFTYPDEVDASDKEGQHIVFECEDVEAIE